MTSRKQQELANRRIGFEFLLFIVLCLFRTAFAVEQGAFVSSGALNLGNQAGWVYYQDHDAPEGAFLARPPAGTTQTTALVDLGQIVPAGDYTLFIKVIDYDYRSRVTATITGASVSSSLNDRDEDKYWTRVGTLRLSAPATTAQITFTKTVPASTATRILFRALYLAPGGSNVVISATDQLLDTSYPTSADYDDSPSRKGNLLGNSSFEVGVGHGWTLSWLDRNWTKASLWDTNVAYHGKSSIRFEAQPSPPQQFISPPIRLKPNKRYTLSAYVRSTGRNWAEIRLINSMKPLEGMPPAQGLVVQKLLTESTKWERLILSERVLAYPSDQFHIILSAQDYDGSKGKVWFDAIQLEEGDVTSYSPRDRVDLGVVMPFDDSIFHPDQSQQARLLVANYSSSDLSDRVSYKIRNHTLHELKTGDFPISVDGNATKTYTLPLDVGRLGSFRGIVWTESTPTDEEEFLYSVLPRPSVSGMDEISLMGTHSDLTDWQLAMFQKAGIKWTRCLSPGWEFRWNIAEPTEGSFVWFDEKIKRAARYGVSILGNIGENAPAWAHRTYFTLSNVSGAFKVGESVRSSNGASGTVSLALDASSATGWALQLSNVQGSFSKSATITGQQSGATAVVSSDVFPTSIALDKWEKFVGAIVSHYKADVRWWEIWNEPNLDTKEVPTAAFYAEMLKRAMKALKSADPNAKTVAMGGIFYPDWAQTVINLLPSAWSNDVAAMTVHLYPGNGTRSASFKTQITDVYKKPVWNSETGVWEWGGFAGINANVLRAGTPLYKHRASERFYRSAVRDPAQLTWNFLESIGGGLTKYFYYDARNNVCRADFFDSHPTLVDYNEGLKPKGVAYAILGHFFDHSTGLGAVTTRDSDTKAYLFDRSGTPSAALFAPNGAEKEIDLALIANQVKAFDFMGNPLASTSTPRYGRFPVYVVGSSVTATQLKQVLQQATINSVPDSVPPELAITLAPRRSVRPGDEVYLRWLAIDNVSLPSEVEPDALQYSWQLEGVDSTWTPWSASTFCTYTNLAPGSYTLLVRCRDQAGNETTAEARTFIVLNEDGTSPKPSPPGNFRVATQR